MRPHSNLVLGPNSRHSLVTHTQQARLSSLYYSCIVKGYRGVSYNFRKGVKNSWSRTPKEPSCHGRQTQHVYFFHLPILLQFLSNVFMLNKALRATGQNKHQLATFLVLFQSKSTEDTRKYDRIRLLYTLGLGTLLHGLMRLKKHKRELHLVFKYAGLNIVYVARAGRHTTCWTTVAHVDC